MRHAVLCLALLLCADAGANPPQCGRESCDCGCRKGEPCRCATAKACPCSDACTCGCNRGGPCVCGGPLPSATPAPLPRTDDEAQPEWATHGVESDKLTSPADGEGKARIRLFRGGKSQEITRDEAVKLIGDKGVPDDAKKIRLTLIGPKEKRQQVLSDLESSPELSPLKGSVVVQSYQGDEPLIRTYGFVTSGQPTIYLQSPSGQVLHRQDEYRGPAALATAIRKADPSYDSSKDPDLNKAAPGGGGLNLDAVKKWLADVPPLAWAAVAGAVLVFVWRKQQ